MLYGCRCGVVGNINFLTTFVDIRFFWIPLSTMKCNRTSFTHICDWNKNSPSSGSSRYFGWILVVTMVALGSTSMICFPLSISEYMLESGSNSETFNLATGDCFVWHSSVLCLGILWKLHHFPMSFFVSPLPFIVCDLDGLFKGWLYLLGPLVCVLGFPFPTFCCDAFADPNSHLFHYLNFCSILTT